jgi:hypothetical protein
MQICAVITGDIVHSRRLSDEGFADVHAAIQRASNNIRPHFPEIPLSTEVFRGDSWQLMVTKPSSSFRIALYFRAFLRAETKADTRFAIGVGPVDSISEASYSERGPAFVLSGTLLDKRSTARMCFGLVENSLHSSGSDDINVIMNLLDFIVRRWTSAQSRAVCGALLGQTQENIAESWPDGPITQQAASQHLARAGWDTAEQALSYFEKVASRWRLA